MHVAMGSRAAALVCCSTLLMLLILLLDLADSLVPTPISMRLDVILHCLTTLTLETPTTHSIMFFAFRRIRHRWP